MIELDRVTVTAGDVTLLAPVSASVPAGRALVIRGRNGSGKSTLLRTLAGLRVPTHGDVSIAGEVVSPRDTSFRRRVAAMIGHPPIAPDLTVGDHVLLLSTTWTDEPRAAREVADGVIDELALSGLSDRYVHELSSGQRQLFALSLVLARPFDVLVLDEPEQRLDPEHVDRVARALHARQVTGATIVVATHSDDIGRRLSGRELWLEAAV